jgi:hypothetical protein
LNKILRTRRLLINYVYLEKKKKKNYVWKKLLSIISLSIGGRWEGGTRGDGSSCGRCTMLSSTREWLGLNTLAMSSASGPNWRWSNRGKYRTTRKEIGPSPLRVLTAEARFPSMIALYQTLWIPTMAKLYGLKS